ncbi:regulator of telomere elongation helicase 1-like [Amphibalanus amphitrite]|uniref:regulator of telomere elongation helicase 1-like n=1 Tax=Amphibalanus amphitrite TaxID=1232801 RepID=UPI001C9237AD|nr:regulator of telomere elongation helicase 1-like [Amphibalanus amphitrite]XP_043245542.1 regulator of telomere elongation helicase 1-like [Amphibalanus amphitrite]
MTDTEISINGVPVRFPFEPYEIQKVYMEKVITCLQQGANGVLESPTGTGKTLCLLCSTLAWAESVRAQQAATVRGMAELNPEFYSALSAQLDQAAGSGWGNSATPSIIGAPKIIFASRTHSQLSQVVQELKRTSYRYVRAVVIGSRDQLCIHPEVSKETNNSVKVHMCQAKVKSRTCHYYNQVEPRRTDKHLTEAPVTDIEDLVTLGNKLNFCPYYMARSLREAADVIFLPYNYLLDPKTRKANGVELQNSVVIFDEAHNIEKMCEESASLQLRSTDIALCVDELTHVLTQLVAPEAGADPEFTSAAAAAELSAENLALMKTMLLELERAIDAIPLPNAADGAHFPGSYMFELLERAQITHGRRAVIVEELEKVISFLTNSATSVFSRRGNGLQKFADLIKVVFNRDTFDLKHMERVKKCYKVHVGLEQQKAGKRPRNDPWQKAQSTADCRVLSYWCFSPGFGMADLMEQGVKCVLLTSGTLAPLSSFTSELQVPFPISLENPHIIQSDQVWVGCISRGPDGTPLSSSYQNRTSARYLSSLGQTVANVARLVPDGLLVFFPSYSMLRACHEAWQTNGVWGRIAANKSVFVETGGKEVFAQNMNDYYSRIISPTEGTRGACFMAVCRGKVSEGLDFSDRNGRAVIITGLPYPPLKDPRVVLKRQYLDEVRRTPSGAGGTQGLSGQDWYRLEASRAVNQAVGRVIRHRRDYGAVILCDSRFGDAGFSGQLSAWVRPYLRVHANFGTVVRELTQFFKSCQEKYPCSSQPAAAASDRSAGPATHATFAFAPSRVSAARSDSNGSGGVPEHGSANPASLVQMYGRTGSGSRTEPGTAGSGGGLLDQMNKWSGAAGAAAGAPGTVKAERTCQSAPVTTLATDAASAPAAGRGRKFKLSHNPAALVLGGRRVPDSTAVLATDCSPPTKTARADERTGTGAGNTAAAVPTPDGTGAAAAATEKATAAAPEKDAKKKSKIADYIIGAKRLLSAADYKLFAAAIKGYTATRDFPELVSSLAGVLVGTGDQQLQQLFRGFAQFVRPEHKTRFEDACRELTGSV